MSFWYFAICSVTTPSRRIRTVIHQKSNFELFLSPVFYDAILLEDAILFVYTYKLSQSILIHCPRSKVNHRLLFFLKTTSKSSVNRKHIPCTPPSKMVAPKIRRDKHQRYRHRVAWQILWRHGSIRHRLVITLTHSEKRKINKISHLNSRSPGRKPECWHKSLEILSV